MLVNNLINPNSVLLGGNWQMKTRFIIDTGALGFMLAVVMFFSLGTIWWLVGFIDPIEAILTGKVAPGTDLFNQYSSILPLYYLFDNILVCGWLVGWVGIALLVRKRDQFFGNTILVLGMAGPILDFLENIIAWALISVCQQTGQVSPDWLIGWQVIRKLSFVIPYSVAVILGVGMWSMKTLDRATAVIGTIGVVLALAGDYFFPLVAMLWWPVWFFNLGLLLWRRRIDFPLEET